jgi:hypothetical protein
MFRSFVVLKPQELGLNAMTSQPREFSISRRSLLMGFLTLATFLRLRRSVNPTENADDEIVSVGRWLLKKSDLS